VWSLRFYWLLIGVLAVWRITHLFHGEDGPWNLMVQLRRMAGEGFWGSLLDCFYCLSLWIAVPFALFLGEGWIERALLWPALSAGAILLERMSSRQGQPSSAPYTEDKEGLDVLRQDPGTTPARNAKSSAS
jgi:hypothetical protein